MSFVDEMWSRRKFVQTAGSITALSATTTERLLAATLGGVTLVVDPADQIATSVPCNWAAQELQRTLSERNVLVSNASHPFHSRPGDLCLVLAGAGSEWTARMLRDSDVIYPKSAEAFVLVPAHAEGRQVLLACGTDVRGLVYATLELLDRVQCSQFPMEALALKQSLVEQPANKLRSINRCFQSEIEDRPWFEDRKMWAAYLDMLASNRFNMFNLSMGLGYDYPQKVTDSYTYFTYPFFVQVANYPQVRARGLSEAQRKTNLELLRFISSQCAVRGIDFTLGLWNHAYAMSEGSAPSYPIEGLTPESHASYCRDALFTLLKECPDITGLTMRVHGESGIPEGQFEFWEVVFQHLAKLDRRISLNLHAKGTSERIISIAQSTGMPVSLSPKYWAEHLGLPYQPASIRELEKPPKESSKAGSLFELSGGARRFMRYSYGDLFKSDRKYDVYFRIWPGTQRVLLWGDPKLAAGDGRGFNMCGSLGVDLFEPLSFKGRGGSGVSSAPGARCSYEDRTLAPRYDWEKFAYSYRVWGRMIYNPNADPQECYRFWNKHRKAGPAIAEALAIASRILRVVTTSQEPSAANWTYWPEMYTNMTIVDPSLNQLYRDTPVPRVYGNVSPLDPQMFVAINQSVDDMLAGRGDSRYRPTEVASWLDGYTASIDRLLKEAMRNTSGQDTPDFRRVVLDIRIQTGLGRFFAAKIRSAALFALYQRTGDVKIRQEALAQYHRARESWSQFAKLADGPYMKDVTYGSVRNMRGHWLDRLPAVDADIAAMGRASATAQPGGGVSELPKAAIIAEIMSAAHRPHVDCQHTPLISFRAGEDLPVTLRIATKLPQVRLIYRHVNQAEYYRTAEMKLEGGVYRAEIPAAYTQSEYALQYYFELQHSPQRATMYPGLGPDLTDRPYFLVEQSTPA